MDTREELEQRFLEVVEDAWYRERGINWKPRQACDALAREVAAALAEMQEGGQTTGPVKDAIPPMASAIVSSFGPQPYPPDARLPTQPAPHYPDAAQPATPPAPEPAGEVADAVDMPNLFNLYVKRGWTLEEESDEVWKAARDDQRAAVEAATKALRERVRGLEEELRRANGRAACDACGGDGKPASGLPCMCRGTGLAAEGLITLRGELFDKDKRIAALEAELVEARKAGAK
jgi:hypothetical protein